MEKRKLPIKTFIGSSETKCFMVFGHIAARLFLHRKSGIGFYFLLLNFKNIYKDVEIIYKDVEIIYKDVEIIYKDVEIIVEIKF